MGVTIECLVGHAHGRRGEWEPVELEFERLEAIFSRFRPESELSALNELGALDAGPELLEVTELALAARERTHGRFDPTVHDALVAAGYDRTFSRVPAESVTSERIPPARCGGEVTVDRGTGRIQLGHGVRLDFGGIAKGYAVDRACDLLAEWGPCLVNAGGDLAVRDDGSDEPWPVAVDTGRGSLTLGLRNAAMATSGRDTRRWRRNGMEQHHLIDPATGSPAAGDLLRVTAVGASAVEAEIRAKSLFLLGEAGAVAEADELGIPSVLVTLDDRFVVAGGLR